MSQPHSAHHDPVLTSTRDSRLDPQPGLDDTAIASADAVDTAAPLSSHIIVTDGDDHTSAKPDVTSPPSSTIVSRDYATPHSALETIVATSAAIAAAPVTAANKLVNSFRFNRSNTEPAISASGTGYPQHALDLAEKGRLPSSIDDAIAGGGPLVAATSGRGALAGLLEPEKPLRPPPTWKTSAWNIVKYSWLNLLLAFIPASFACHHAGVGSTATFCVSFGAIIPLAALLGFATEELAIRVGHTLGGLMNATLGNTVELIIAILALTKGELRVVQSSMIGSILSNCLLVLGCCFFAGGIRFHEQVYTIRAAQLNSGLLGMSALVVVIPAAYNVAMTNLNRPNNEIATDNDILQISRGTAVILLFVYAMYLFFQFWTHAYLYTANNTIVGRSRDVRPRAGEENEPLPPEDVSVLRVSTWRTRSGTTSSSDSSSVTTSNSDEDGSETPKLKVQAAIVLILIVTAFTGLIAEYLVDSIDGLTRSGNISREFVGVILLPLVGNAAEHMSAVTVSVKDKLDLSISIAVGSSIQIALFVLPLLIMIGWGIGKPLSLEFDVLETIVLFISVVIVNQAISDGKTNWMEGLTLMIVYLVIALSFFYYPGSGSIA